MTVIPFIGYLYIRFLRVTTRITYRGEEVLDEVRGRSGNYILAFWHSRLVMMPYVYPGDRLVVLASKHRDSLMLSRILHRFGLTTAFGSSTHGGVAGVREILRRVREGYDVGITPDGPKGPRRRVKAGVIATARFTGLPIIPVAFSATRGRRLGSWDRTLLPWPFGKGVFVYGRPMEIPKDADEAEQERYRLELEVELDRLTDDLDRETGIGPEEPRPTEVTG
jgi:lysophospholipid acyltransferase (LPLAT)-like uncharacterized protein